MIYIGTTEDNGSAIYFDVYATERQKHGLRISGTIGDGCYEGEALVELGHRDSVTFADAWLGGSGFAEFLARCGNELLELSLIAALRAAPRAHARRSRPHGHRQAAPVVAEHPPAWLGGV